MNATSHSCGLLTCNAIRAEKTAQTSATTGQLNR